MEQLKVTSVSLTPDQITYTKGKGNTSRYIRSLIDREMGNEQAAERCQALVRAYQSIIDRQKQKESGDPDR
ncbi:hypothetical protein [Desulfosporosinus youngiae]|uniref:Uncharacterized protein n=1 Tax=Desulfosporosinus youngiae DSM 17734 TaxID=768710 RepID=H5Y0C8_9FIRM|nr:hypothetical protein [Desulfosporosinus youngiae]EHQ92107.1 hypothetical protein DesyoDRAFT_5176 [Desulfosporosinus youngiae DSM 17734]